jgi:hypothetical protein
MYTSKLNVDIQLKGQYGEDFRKQDDASTDSKIQNMISINLHPCRHAPLRSFLYNLRQSWLLSVICIAETNSLAIEKEIHLGNHAWWGKVKGSMLKQII